jgi:hypothetical protein
MVIIELKSLDRSGGPGSDRIAGSFAMKWRFKLIAALAALATGPLAAQAQQQIEIFDAHLHYNQEPRPFYSLEQVREVFRRNGITGMRTATKRRYLLCSNTIRRQKSSGHIPGFR